MPDNPTDPPAKDELERLQLQLSNEKLKIETRRLEQEAKPENWWSKLAKNIVAIGGILTVAATGYGIWESYDKTITDRMKSRAADQRTRFEDAIKRLELPSTISKLVGVSVLSGYLNPENQDSHRQILFTLSGLMATEKDFQTQAAVLDLIKSLPAAGIIAPSDWLYFQDNLVSQSRALMVKANLQRRRQFLSTTEPTADEQAARIVGKLIAIVAKKGVVQDYRNYRGIYCATCDFSGVIFPQDVDFTGSVLDGANFRGATLPDARFDNAELESASFVEADLRRARFRNVDEIVPIRMNNDEAAIGSGAQLVDKLAQGRTAYLDHIVANLDSLAEITVFMPDFSCAHLEDADFTGHTLFPGLLSFRRVYSPSDITKSGWFHTTPDWVKDKAKETGKDVDFSPLHMRPPKFVKAILNGANFESIAFFDFYKGGSMAVLKTHMNASLGVKSGDFTLLKGYMDNDVFRRIDERESNDYSWDQSLPLIRKFQIGIRAAFYAAEYQQAKLPRKLKELLNASTPSHLDYETAFGSQGVAEPDLNCNTKAR